MFVEVESENLVVDTKYAILSTFNTAMDILKIYLRIICHFVQEIYIMMLKKLERMRKRRYKLWNNAL
jgi:hypothetical protein